MVIYLSYFYYKPN